MRVTSLARFHARHLEARRLLLTGQVDAAELTLTDLDPAPFPPAWRATYELVLAGIALSATTSGC